MELLRRPVIDRLPRYYHYLFDLAEQSEQEIISSSQIASAMHVDDTLVRRDLATIGVRGQPKIGYRIEDVLATIRNVLGFDIENNAVIVGAGRLGQALAAYPGFGSYGLRIVGAFDNDIRKQGQGIDHLTIKPLTEIGELISTTRVDVAILTLPADVAQQTAEMLVAAGIGTFWNFALVNLEMPENIIVRNEVLSVGLAEISYRLKLCNRKEASTESAVIEES